MITCMASAAVARELEPPVAQQVAPGVYWFAGSTGEASPANAGRIGNASFIVGPLGVLAVDSGSSYAHGLELLGAIRRTTDQPIRALLLTQARPEFIFGAKAFQDAGVPVWMHQRALDLMLERCALCLSRLRKILGVSVMAGTEIVRPDFSLGEGLSTGLIGRPLQILDLGPSSGPGDLAVWDASTATLIAAGLVDHQRIPRLFDDHLEGWLRALDVLAELPLAQLIPGHGPPGSAGLLGQHKQYLQALGRSVQSAMQSGLSLGQLADLPALGPWTGWDGYPQQHVQNLQILYLRLEQRWLQQP
ncbi:MAG: MBL fold metallo-hydrolase [Betaproteobacteria bacterium]